MSEIKKPQSPAERAKEFAADNGFEIVTVGRRYDVRIRGGVALVANVGGYTAALNAMRAHLLDIEAFNNPNDVKMKHCDVVRDDGVMGVFADAPVGVEMCAGEIKAASVAMLAQQHRDYNDLKRGTGDAVATRIRRAARKLSGKPPGGPWHVVHNGQNVTVPGYASRTDALAVVRWGFNHPDLTIRNNWRTATVTLEYRQS